MRRHTGLFFVSLRNRRTKNVTSGSDGFYEFRLLGIGFDLPAKAADLHVDAAIEGAADPAPREVKKLIASQDMLRMLGKSQKQVIFAGRKLDERPLRVAQCSPDPVELPTLEGQG